MKTISRFAVLFASFAAVPGALIAGCGDDAVTGEDQNVTEGQDDPFVNVVLAGGCSVKDEIKNKTVKTEGSGGKCPTKVKDVLDALAADNESGTEFYLVSELGDRPAEDVQYRYVVAHKGKGDGAKHSDLFFSTLGNAGGISQGFLEVMAFDKKKQAYNYYALAGGKWNFKGDGTMAATDPGDGEPAFECLNCHKSGTPIMKELQDGWSNWHSTWFSPTDPKSEDETFKKLFSGKSRADDLEDFVIEGTKAHNKGLIERATKAEELQPLLKRLLCDVDTGNLISVHSKSSTRFGTVSTFSSMLPTSHLISQLFKTPSTGSGKQGGYTDILAMSLPSLSSVNVPGASYVKAVTDAKQQIGGEAGDAMFPWFGAEKGYSDNDVIQQLVEAEILDKDLVADALMTDFTVPVFSEARCELADTLPEEGEDADAVRKAWIENLGESSHRGAAGLKARLENGSDFEAHQAQVEKFLAACVARKTSEADAFAADMLKIVSQRRLEFTEHFEAVVESPFLLPTDDLGSQPGALRLNGDTCQLEQQTAKFVGEDTGSSDGSTNSSSGTGTGTGTGGGGGEGGGDSTSSTSSGEGGGSTSTSTSTGTGGGSCAHSECVAGVALEASCSACAAAVCGEDDFCCGTEWDTTCVGIAQGNAACNCD